MHFIPHLNIVLCYVLSGYLSPVLCVLAYSFTLKAHKAEVPEIELKLSKDLQLLA